MIKLANCEFDYKLVNGMLPEKTEQICFRDSNKGFLKKKNNKYDTRHKNLPNTPKTKHNGYLNSFLCKGPSTYQTLPVEMKSKPSLTISCKKHVMEHD